MILLDRCRGIAFDHPVRLVVFLVLTTGIWSPAVYAQRNFQRNQSKAVPGPTYFAAFNEYQRGDYSDALQDFRRAARNGVFSSLGRWVDAICYHTMAGECYYHMGNLTQALDQYDTAIRIHLAQQGWLLRVRFPDRIAASPTRRSDIQWGSSNRQSVVGRIPETMLSFQGRMDNENALRRGGVVAAPEMVPLRVSEILRCLALSIRRRNELMGPACRHDPLTGRLIQSLRGPQVPPNHWSEGWIDALLGLAYLGADQQEQATKHLQRAIVLDGQFDHPLTPCVLLELGKSATARDQLEMAAELLLEATYVGAYYYQADVVAEAFDHAATVHLISNQPGVYAPLIPATRWARIKNLDPLCTALLLMTSEQLVYRDNVAQAETTLRDAGNLLGRRDMRQGRLGTRFHFQTALLQFERGRVNSGETALREALAWGHNSSLRLFQIALVEKLFQEGKITPRITGTLFDGLLTDPTASNWVHQPFESLSFVTSPADSAWVQWFLLAHDNKQFEKALEIADHIRRRRFYASLPLGGRLLALRWLLAAPNEMLSEEAKLQRQDMLVKYPELAKLFQDVAKLRQTISAQPVAPDGTKQTRELSSLFQNLTRMTDLQEHMLHRLAVRREPSEFSFPPRTSVGQMRKKIRSGQLFVIFFAVDQQLFVYALSKDKYSNWLVDPSANVHQLTAAILRRWGNHDRNNQLKLELLQDKKWKSESAELLAHLFPKNAPEDWDSIEELVIVPDGVLWYLPFETLHREQDGGLRPLVSTLKIRYAPTLSLANPHSDFQRPIRKMAVVPGKIFSKDDNQSATETVEKLTALQRETLLLESPQLAPTRMAAPFWDRLTVLQDISDSKRLPYEWAPAQTEAGKPGNRLSDWFLLPWGAPAQVLLPGFHSPAEDGLKRAGIRDGSELFLTTCGLMATGARTVLINRWRSGGQTAYDLIVEFSRELPNSDAATAWQRSVQLTRGTELDPQREPRVRFSPNYEGGLTADHPFFWAGPMLLDTGTHPHANPDPVQAKLNPAAAARRAAPR
ncbi:MAG: CHAT domain-containing protein [Pirellulaceae bacterium]|nr:CHAT domain-containing protein [Pirellulaceae bacterium]